MRKTIDFSGDVNAYGLLSSAVAPRPIAFASTVDGEGRVNLSPFSFFNVFGANPPTLVFAPVRSARTMDDKDTLKNLREVPEVTINIVNYAMVEQMSLTSTAYERGVNEYIKAGFTEQESSTIRPPFVGESPVAFECVVRQIIETGPEGGAGHLVICEVLVAHVQEEYMKDGGIVDALKLDLVARMGENWYCRASADAMFEVEKPLRKKGLGVDSLPRHVRESKVLTGNDLGRLGNVEEYPTADRELTKSFADVEDVHVMAHKLIAQDRVRKALHLLVSYDAD